MGRCSIARIDSIPTEANLQIVNGCPEVTVGVDDDGVDLRRVDVDEIRIGGGFFGGDLLQAGSHKRRRYGVEVDRRHVQRRLNRLRKQL